MIHDRHVEDQPLSPSRGPTKVFGAKKIQTEAKVGPATSLNKVEPLYPPIIITSWPDLGSVGEGRGGKTLSLFLCTCRNGWL